MDFTQFLANFCLGAIVLIIIPAGGGYLLGKWQAKREKEKSKKHNLGS